MKKNFNIEEPHEQLIIRFLNGHLSLEEINDLYIWIESSLDNRKIFKVYQNIWIGGSAFTQNEDFNPQKAWKKMTDEINKPSFRQIYQSSQKARRIYYRYAQIAALFLAVFTLGSLVSYLTLSPDHKIYGEGIFEISVPLGSRSRIVLPDSSIVWLNAGSMLSYPHDFNYTERLVKLEGEAYFDITTNPIKPFIVKTSHLDVKALGTQFNVKAYPDDNAILTTLVEGKLIIEMPGKERPLIYALEPRQSFTYQITEKSALRLNTFEPVIEENEKPEKAVIETPIPADSKPLLLVKSNIRPEKYTSWKDETWIIEGETMDDMAKMMERRFNTKIEMKSADLKRYRFTGKIKNETLEQVLEILSMTTPLKYTVGKGIVYWEVDSNLKKEYDELIPVDFLTD
jgi:transmembrane sensor